MSFGLPGCLVSSPSNGLAPARPLSDALVAASRRNPTATALLSPNRQPVTFVDLLDHVETTAKTLTTCGVGPYDRVAIALPDSAELAVVMMAVMHCATAVPLNARMTVDELCRQIRDTRAAWIIVPAGSDSPALQAARQTGLAVFEMKPAATGGTGQVELSFAQAGTIAPAASDMSQGVATALVAQTSGTTGRSKVVALTQANLLASLTANSQALDLGPSDRSLVVMPLHHVHGLAAVICPLLTGGSAAVAGSFSAAEFFGWMSRFEPTWYTAVPTIHQSVLDRAADEADVVRGFAERRMLRFIRSGSAPMPRGIPERLERTFNTIYLEASGATEGFLFCSNRPGRRRIGSVGIPLPGIDVHIVDPQGRLVNPDVEGELIAKSPGLAAGYENNVEATQAAFKNGYFHTGDLGKMDDDGFFYITGRLKEQINRGGRKISPLEVDEALCSHPAVKQAVTFALPDPLQGEEVAAAVVLRTGSTVSELDLQRHVAGTLADYKVPRKIVFRDELLKTPTGKIVRVGLAERLGLAADVITTAPGASPAAPHTPTQKMVASIWSGVLGAPVDDLDVPFPTLGGDSLQALSVCLLTEQKFGKSFPLATLSRYTTVRAMADLLEGDGATPTPGAPIVLREGDRRHPALFMVAGIGGNVYRFHTLARHLPAERRIVGLPLPGADGLEPAIPSIPAIADRFLRVIREDQPTGPYFISGYSFGGRVAHEIARKLIDDGQTVAMLALIDTPGPNWPGHRGWRKRLKRIPGKMARIARRLIGSRKTSPNAADVGPATLPIDGIAGAAESNVRSQYEARVNVYREATRLWQPLPLPIPILLLKAQTSIWGEPADAHPAMGWAPLTKAGVRIVQVPGSHDTLFLEPHVATLSRHL